MAKLTTGQKKSARWISVCAASAVSASCASAVVAPSAVSTRTERTSVRTLCINSQALVVRFAVDRSLTSTPWLSGRASEDARDDGRGQRVGFAIERLARQGRILLHAGKGRL